MHRTLVPVVTLGALLGLGAAPAGAQDLDPREAYATFVVGIRGDEVRLTVQNISDEYLNCRRQAGGYGQSSTGAEVNCAERELAKLERRINAVYGELRSKLTPQEFGGLQAFQRLWIPDRDRICAQADPTLEGRLEGLECRMRVTAVRTADLTYMLQRVNLQPTAAEPAGPRQLPAIQTGAPYVRAREALLAAGFRPRSVPNAAATIAERCGSRDDVCQEYEEAEACSGTGVGACLFAFSGEPNQIVRITTSGEELADLRVLRVQQYGQPQPQPARSERAQPAAARSAPARPDLARVALGQQGINVLRQGQTAAAIRQVMGDAAYRRAIAIFRSGWVSTDAEQKGQYVLASACQKQNCMQVAVSAVFDAAGNVWAATIDGDRVDFFGNPPAEVRELLANP